MADGRLTDGQVAALADEFGFETTDQSGRIRTELWDTKGQTTHSLHPDCLLKSLALEVLAGRAVLATLRKWMAEYPNDKYTGAWWLAELDRIMAADFTRKEKG